MSLRVQLLLMCPLSPNEANVTPQARPLGRRLQEVVGTSIIPLLTVYESIEPEETRQ